MSSCCGSSNKENPSLFARIDWIFWVGIIVVGFGFIYYNFNLDFIAYAPLETFSKTVDEFIRLVWWGIVLGIIFVGLLDFVPRDMAIKLVGKPGTKRGVVQSAFAGIAFDLCSHGILLVAMKLYERGASLGQVMAFLIASPWNSISLTIILFALIGVKWTLAFIALSFVIAVLSGFLFDAFVKRKTLASNPNQFDQDHIMSFKEIFKEIDWSKHSIWKSLKTAMHESRMIIRWMFVGIILIGLVRAFVDISTFETLFAPTIAGLGLTLVAATIIEVCSEGLAPIAADLLNRAAAPGNAFAFLMAGVATDYTEIMAVKETARSWKTALFIPLITVPQIVVLAYLMNVFG